MSVAGTPTDRFADDFADLGHPMVHQRSYEVRGFHLGGTRLLIRGVVDDQAPAGMAVPGDPESLTLHHMIVDVTVDVMTTIIEAVDVRFEENPHATCPTIAPAYQQLVGASMGRGYSNRVRELFGGPRSCTHVVALLQAMAPLVAQSRWPLFARLQSSPPAGHSAGSAGTPDRDEQLTTDQRRTLSHVNLNTCHIWADDGAMMGLVNEGAAVPVPNPILRRMKTLGLEPEVWTSTHQPGRGPASG